MRIAMALGAGLLALAACTPAEEQAEADAETAEVSPKPSGKPAPEVFAATAWRVIAEDGARYITMLDPGGTYRDLRNGDPFQEGKWSYAEGPEGKQLCFEPEDENGVETCWMPGRTKDGLMAATGPGGRRIELEKVAYEPASEAESDAPE